MADGETFPNSLPVLYVRGTHYEVGHNVGRTFSRQIATFVKDFSEEECCTYFRTKDGRELFDNLVKVADQRFPQYMRELRGTADGANVPCDELIMANLLPEIYRQMFVMERLNKSCTDIMVNNDNESLIAHNEDLLRSMCVNDYILHVHIDEYTDDEGRTYPDEKFVAYTTGGNLPGGFSGFNNHGLAFGVNSLVCDVIIPDRAPEIVISRYALTARSKEEFLTMMADEGHGNNMALSFNASFKDDDNLYSIEVLPQTEKESNLVSVREVAPTSKGGCGYYYHTNHVVHREEDLSQIPPGTLHRYNRLEHLDPPKNIPDILNRLGDTEDDEFPIFRRAKGKANTACTDDDDELMFNDMPTVFHSELVLCAMKAAIKEKIPVTPRIEPWAFR